MLVRTLMAVGLLAAWLGGGPALAAEQVAEAGGTAARIDLQAAPAGGTGTSSAGETGDPLAPPDTRALPLTAPGVPPAAAAAPAPVEVDPIVLQVRSLLAAGSAKASAADREDRAALAAFYGEGDGRPAWVGKDGLTTRAGQVMAEIGRAGDWALDAKAFELPAPVSSSAQVEQLAEAEIKLSAAVLKYARHARGGRLDPPSVSRLHDRTPQVYEPRSVLTAIAATQAPDAYLRALHPRHPQFERLRAALLGARGRSGETPSAAAKVKIPPGAKLKPGDSHAHVALLRERLGVAAEAGRESVFDADLAQALKAWQLEHAHESTGILTNATRTALNGTVIPTSRDVVQRLIVNMERWRWMPDDLGALHVMDNVPEQVARVYKDGKVVFAEKIVVGKPITPTPSFSADMQFVIFHPEWGVPDGIKTNEIAPRLRETGGGGWFGGGGSSAFLGRHNLRVMYNGRQVDPDSVNWGSVDIRRFQFIQPAGGKNVLGVVKFRFPNKHDVYMHDTPERHLFNSGLRAFSHGCMRVQNPVRLAEVLLGHDKGWGAEKVRAMADHGGTNEVRLSTPVPVHVVYFTAAVEDDGRLRTFGDLYGVDSRIASALEGRPVHLVAQAAPPEPAEPEARGNVRVKRRAAQAGSGDFFSGLFGN